MSDKEKWFSQSTCDASRGCSLKIHNPNGKGLPIAVTIPVDMIFAADIVLRVMCYRGDTSPELRIYVGDAKEPGGIRWNCEYGAIKTWSVTPWGALQKMGQQIEALAEVEA